MTPESRPIGVRTNNPATNLAISADFPAMFPYNLFMLDEENSRLKSLLIATTGFYALSWVITMSFGKFIYSDSFVLWSLEHSYAIWLTWFLMFLAYAWVPLSVFLLFQGLKLTRAYSAASYPGDRTVGHLSIYVPLGFLFIYIFTRILY